MSVPPIMSCLSHKSSLIIPHALPLTRCLSRVASHALLAVRTESLFVLGPGGVLVEYKLECTVLNGSVPADDAPIQLVRSFTYSPPTLHILIEIIS